MALRSTVPRPHVDDAPDDLVRRALGGETEAFALVIRRYASEVWKLAEVLLDDPLARENLVQQTFVNAFERLDQYQIGRDLGLWLKGIARNLAREELRRRSRERGALSRYYTHILTFLSSDDEADTRQRSIERALADCRSTLAPAAARTIELYYERGLSLPDVGKVLGRTPTATRLLVFRARLALRACIERRMASP
jgi:RNA polymerase sigma-70 factor (ECF subfamily)